MRRTVALLATTALAAGAFTALAGAKNSEDVPSPDNRAKVASSVSLLSHITSYTPPPVDASGIGMDRSLARSVTSTVGVVRVIPADGMICLEQIDGNTGAAGSCAPDGIVAQGGLLSSLGDAGETRDQVAGVVPDNVALVVAGNREIPVSSNIWSARNIQPTAVAYKDAAGSVVGRAVIP